MAWYIQEMKNKLISKTELLITGEKKTTTVKQEILWRDYMMSHDVMPGMITCLLE